MSNLEDRLKQIQKIEVTERDIHYAKSNIIEKARKHKFNLIPTLVMVSMFAILCFLIFVPTSTQTERATSILTDEIEEIQFIRTNLPYLNYRVDSFNYILAKRFIEDEKQIQEFQKYLQQFLVNPQPYTEKIEGNKIYDFVFKMKSGEVVYLKYDPFGHENRSGAFYDTKEKVKYVVPNYEDLYPLHDLIGESKSILKWNLTYTILILIVACFSIGILDYIYRKKYGVLDEQGKRKSLTGWKNSVPYFIFFMPLYLMITIVGTIHLGLMIILIHMYILVQSQLEIKYGVVRKNDIHLKIILPLTSTLAIIGLLLILVV